MAQILSKPNISLDNFYGIVTASEEMRQYFTYIKRAARTDAAVLIRGESGTGKELVASALHQLSKRASHPFSAINCATLTAELLASELFGHVKGAFTGAIKDKKGLFQAVDKGSLFLDEIGETPLDIQARLLRVLQDKSFIPLGSTSTIKVDVRIISATNKSLRQLVEQGKFREDLMYRIRVVPLFLPRLIERKGDIEALTWHFIGEENQKGLRTVTGIEKRAFEALMSYPWPGNVRELRNNIEFAFAIGEGDVLTLKELTPELQGINPAPERNAPTTIKDIERKKILTALDDAKGKKGPAAAALGMSRATLWRKMREYGIY